MYVKLHLLVAGYTFFNNCSSCVVLIIIIRVFLAYRPVSEGTWGANMLVFGWNI